MIHTARRKGIAAVALLTLAAATGACGSDDDKVAPTTTTPAPTSAAAVTAVTGPAAGAGGNEQFCQGFTALDRAFGDSPDDPAEMQAFVDEKVTPNVVLVKGDTPPSITAEVTVMLDTVDEALATGDFEVFQQPEFGTAAHVVYGSLDDECGIPVVDVDLIDYAYQGLPKELPAGLTSFVVDNRSTKETHQIELVKVKPGVEQTAAEMLAMPEEEVNALLEQFGGGTGATAGGTGGTTAELTPGRWIAVCLIPVTGDEAHGHWEKGMVQEFTVA